MTYRSLSGSSYIKLPVEFRSSKKGLINVKNDNQQCFSWCHARCINSVKVHPERITQSDKKLANDLDYDGVDFMFYKTKNKNKKYFCKSCLKCFSSKNVLTEHKEVFLSINGAQSVKLGKGSKYWFRLKFMLILSVI